MSEIEAIRALLRATVQRPQPPLAEMRAGYEAFGQASPMAGEVEARKQVLGGAPALTLTPPGARGAVLYLHGGGYAIGSTISHAPMAAQLALAAGAVTHVLDYRLAPENRFPAAVDDAVAAFRALLSAGARPADIAIAGDSAGGGLTVATALALKQRGLPQPAALFCISPWIDLTQSGVSYVVAAERDLIVSKPDLDNWASLYLGAASPTEPLASPVYGDLSGLAPMLIHVGADEVLLSDSVRLAEAAGLAGVPVELHIAPDMPHVWHFMFAQLTPARQAIADAGQWLRARLAGSITAN